jgi:hypothetical protein
MLGAAEVFLVLRIGPPAGLRLPLARLPTGWFAAGNLVAPIAGVRIE